jgi:hypothetical protein
VEQSEATYSSGKLAVKINHWIDNQGFVKKVIFIPAAEQTMNLFQNEKLSR